MSLPEASGSSLPSSASFHVAAPQSSGATPGSVRPSAPATSGAQPFVERRRPVDPGSGQPERRQFGSSHANLSEDGRELALAIDRYKIEHHRRYLTCDEMLVVLSALGYSKQGQ